MEEIKISWNKRLGCYTWINFDLDLSKKVKEDLLKKYPNLFEKIEVIQNGNLW